ncbi:MAG TPA: MEDS domain-containing protein, partial [Sporichthyaceae bacterium]|nr:MEDS domain-containing protein [Sporichthyaceae bacterium]
MFSSRIGLAVPGVELRPGDHICAFYPSLEERDNILVPYIREGLAAGDKCICVIDGPDVAGLEDAFGAPHDDGADGPRQLEMRRSEDTYLNEGKFSTDAMLEFWDIAVGGALENGFEFSRAAGEMTWALRHMPGVEDLIVYEAQLNRFLPKYPQVIMCLYEL